MTVYIDGHDFAYELENVARMFYDSVTVVHGAPAVGGVYAAATAAANAAGGVSLRVEASTPGGRAQRHEEAPADLDDKGKELILARGLYDVLSELTGLRPAWGVVTGIRPAKLAAKLSETLGEEGAKKAMCEQYYVREDKARLALECARASERIKRLNAPDLFSLYVSIPFCPTRCSYCSFVSKTIGREKALVEPYVQKLCEELRACGALTKSLGLRLATVYFGGGTPTSLEAPQLDALFSAIAESFSLSDVLEYCVEAGRPDTVSEQKLLSLKRAGVTRISINPQTGSDEVLKNIARGHTVADVERAFELAQRAGFDNINGDLIAGLPGDNFLQYKRTLDWLLALAPQSITLHALTLKRASSMTEEGGRPHELHSDAGKMLSYTNELLVKRGFAPYYMYKQKGTVDSLENTGYCLPGHECLYNVFIMDELHTIIACGAGAVTKLVNQSTGLIQRVFNYKYPAEYISGFDEILKRKENIREIING